MKTKLTIEKSQRLIESGISIDKSSDFAIYDEPCRRAYMPIFTLTDLLEILPKEAVFKDDFGRFEKYYLGIDWSCNHEWVVYYANTTRTMSRKNSPELIDALYSLLIWLIDNKHL